MEMQRDQSLLSDGVSGKASDHSTAKHSDGSGQKKERKHDIRQSRPIRFSGKNVRWTPHFTSLKKTVSANNQRKNYQSKEEFKMSVAYTTKTNKRKSKSCTIKAASHSSNSEEKVRIENKERKVLYKLKNLVGSGNNEILFSLCIPSTDIFHLLENSTCENRDIMAFLLIAVGKACTSSHRRNVISLLSNIFQIKHFVFCALPKYLVSFLQNKNEKHHEESLLKFLDFLIYFHQSLPASASDILTVVMPLLKNACVKVFETDQIILKSLLNKIKILEEQKELFIKEHSRQGILKASKAEKLNVQQPPNDFRTISIFPTVQDIQECETFLRPNITIGCYSDAEHYLDVQFRLLREDYVRPLREGIGTYLTWKKHGKPLNKIRDVRVYQNVHIVKQDYLNGVIVHLVKFDIKKFEHINWEYSKRFLSGSLLCLSCDNFETMFFASVVDRDCKLLNKGILILKFENLPKDMLDFDSTLNFVLVESNAYFEAYRHNLSALSKMASSDFAMQKYIVYAQKVVDAPAYLQAMSTYNMRPLLQPRNDQLKSVGCFYNADRVILLDYTHWPSEKDLHLDKPQYEALRAAVTKEFAIIQGPPGTGKTYIGLRIVQLLLHNISTEKFGPLFILCYTNHALDQFLEGILQYCKNIVRVGGRCASEVLVPFRLKNVRNVLAKEKKVPPHIFHAMRSQNACIHELKEEIDFIYNGINETTKTIFSEEVLFNYMSDKHYYSLKSIAQNSFMNECDQNIMYWLSVYSPEAVNVEELASDLNYFSFSSLCHEYEPSNQFLMFNSYPEENGVGSVPCSRESDIQNNDPLSVEAKADIEFIEGIRQVEEEGDNTEKIICYPKGNSDSENEVNISDGNGWQTQGGKKKRKKYINKNLKSNDVMSAEEARKILNVWRLDLKDRWRLYRYWMKQFVKAQHAELLTLQCELHSELEKLNEMREEENLYILRSSKVIGMTTTGAAKYKKIINDIGPQVIIIEEAAEILESHIVTSLTANTKHLILIGDHQQLRPNPNVYELATKFNLNISLFERMVNNGVEYHQLSSQHRMRPSISSLLVPHIYPALDNHESVMNLEDIKGMHKNVFFLNHNIFEHEQADSQSYINYHEAEFVTELCTYLMLQGYNASQITILTTYSGQLFAIRKLTQLRLCQDVRVTVVDNFQGEENDIILISFVRSNEEGNIGFLKVPNRICVALSRARKGLFCIGNFQLFAKKCDLWEKILEKLKEMDSFGNSLRLRCQNHPDTYTVVSKSTDFVSVPEGGCNIPCEYRLECGHKCASMCHPLDLSHEDYKCWKACTKILCEKGHKCPKMCHEVCGPCEVPQDKTFPSCSHIVSVPCHIFTSVSKCPEPCTKILHCGHLCKRLCSEDCDYKLCNESQSSMKEHFTVSCCYPCNSVLPCGHTCTGTCSKCYQGRVHQACRERCRKTLICGHKCSAPCSKSCPPCEETCGNFCIHGTCNSLCGLPCVICYKPCSRFCEHKKCTNLCFDLCSYEHCKEPCSKTLQCGHKCWGLCSESCPECVICNPDQIGGVNLCLEGEMNDEKRFIQLQECKHIFDVKKLENWMEVDREINNVQMKVCPECGIVIKTTNYFINTIKRSVFSIERVKNHIVETEKYLKSTDVKKYFIPYLSFKQAQHPALFAVMMLPLYEFLKKNKIFHPSTLIRCLNVVNISNNVFDMEEMYENFDLSLNIENTKSDSLNNLYEFTKKRTRKLITDFFSTEYLTASEAQLKEITREVERYKLQLKLLHFAVNAVSETPQNVLEAKYSEVVEKLCKHGPIEEKDEVALKQLCGSLGLTELNFIESDLLTLNFSNDFCSNSSTIKSMFNTLLRNANVVSYND